MSFFDDEEMLHDEGLCDPAFCRFCATEPIEEDDEDDEDET